MNKLEKFINDLHSWDIKKSDLKEFINENWFFSKSIINLVGRSDADKVLEKKRGENEVVISDKIPEWESIYIYEGIISQQYGKWENNRNWYKIDKNGWNLEEYKLNPAILLMHDSEKWVIGNMIKVGVVKEWLKGMFWIDVNNISDEWIRNQIKTWTLKASSTWSLVSEYMFEDRETWKNYNESDVIEKYWEREVIKCFRWISDIFILNVTKSIMLETSIVSIWSNYKAVDWNTLNRYFNSLLSNKMTPEQIAAAKLENENKIKQAELNKENGSPIGDEIEDGANPEAKIDNQENHVEEELETPNPEPTNEVEEQPSEEEEITTPTENEVEEPVVSNSTQTATNSMISENDIKGMSLEDAQNLAISLQNQLQKANEKLAEQEEIINKPVIDTTISKSSITTVPENNNVTIDPKQASKQIAKNMREAR